MIRDIIDLVFSVFSIILFFVVIYMILLKLTGHSLTLDQITVALSVGTTVLVVKIFYDTGRLSSSVEHTRDDVKEIKSDIKDVRKEMSLKFEKINRDFERINRDLTIIKTKLIN